MLKISKYMRLTKSLPQLKNRRFMSRNDHCCRNIPPMYECKQPEKNETEEYLERLRRARIPKVFEKHPVKDYKVYKNIFLFLCIPAVVCVTINTFCLNNIERKRPKFIEFTYMRLRRKPFPWDPERTLFHNPRYNALPSGYEIEVPEEEEYDPFESCPQR